MTNSVKRANLLGEQVKVYPFNLDQPELLTNSLRGIKVLYAMKETFHNVKILTDGEIKSIYFDYVFYKGDYKSNWGNESWQLIKTDNDWQINAVIFSMTFNNDSQ